MKVDLSKLEVLKDKLIHAKEFKEPLHYFFDHFGDHVAFIQMGDAHEDEFLQAILEQVAMQLFPKGAVLAGVRLTRLAEQGFVHGGITVNGNIGNIFYFEDIRQGLITVIVGGETKMARFSGRPLTHNRWSRSDN